MLRRNVIVNKTLYLPAMSSRFRVCSAGIITFQSRLVLSSKFLSLSYLSLRDSNRNFDRTLLTEVMVVILNVFSKSNNGELPTVACKLVGNRTPNDLI